MAGTRTILLVDDASTCREPIAMVLRRQGYRVLCAGSGRQALELLEDHWPDAVLLDLAMPDMDGVDVLRVIRQAPQWQELPVILFTGSGEVRHLLDGMGVQDCLVKSACSPAEIRVAVERALCSRSTGLAATC